MVDIRILVLAGALGGFVRHILSGKGTIVLPSWEWKEGKLFFSLGFLFNVILGAIFGLLVPYGLGPLVQAFFPQFPLANDLICAFFGGLGSADIFENLLERIFGRLGKGKEAEAEKPLERTGIPI